MTPDLTFEFVYVAFWIYIAFALMVCIPMLMIWFNSSHDVSSSPSFDASVQQLSLTPSLFLHQIKTFTPAWAFLVFPLMLVGIVAINVLRVFPLLDPRAINVLLVGYVSHFDLSLPLVTPY